MTFTIRDAEAGERKLLLGLYGQSGAGKTYSALLLARGLAGPNGRVVMIDTESGRGSLYADVIPGGYQVLDLEAPFSPKRYIEAIAAVEKSDASVLIIDSASHEWEGLGGVLEMAGENEAKSGKAGLHNWNRPKLEHNKFVLKLLGSRLHVIVCVRGKYKSRQVKKGGKTEIIKDDYVSPIQDDGFIFEMTVHAEVLPDHRLRINKCSHPDLPKCIPDGEIVTVQTGEAVARWSQGMNGKGRASGSSSPAGASTAEPEGADSAQQPDQLPGMDDDAGIPDKTFQWLVATSMTAETKDDFEKWRNKAKIATAMAGMNADQKGQWVRHVVELESRWAAAAAGDLDDMPPPSEPADAPDMAYTG